MTHRLARALGAIALIAAAGSAAEAQDRIENSIGMRFVAIPGGSFLMGSPPDEYGRLDDDEALHRVAVSAFTLGMHEVTQAQYARVVGSNPSHFAKARGSANLPVESVTWAEAADFCRRLSELPEERGAGRRYRLPTEAEWEYACRAGGSSAYSFGDDFHQLDDHAWYSKNSNELARPVGLKRPNRFGLHDMHGNVAEWVADWYGPYASEPASDPAGPSAGEFRITRGGSFNHWSIHCRSANRNQAHPDARSYTRGFRVVLETP